MKNTKLIRVKDISNASVEIDEAACLLRDGGIVIFPTETVYGLGASAYSKEAVKKVFEAKGRPQDNPLICHIASFDSLSDVASYVPEEAVTLAKEFWPGPLTLVLKKNESIADEVTCGLDTVGVRMPDHPVALRLLEKAGVPIAAPSANISGSPSPTRIEHVIEDMMNRVDAIIDGGDCSVGIESTVLDMTKNPPIVLRPGGVTLDMLQQINPFITVMENHAKESVEAGIRSPGLKHRHYAPKAPLYLVTGDFLRQTKIINEQIENSLKRTGRIGLILTEEMADTIDVDILKSEGIQAVIVGRRDDLASVAKNLFAALRFFENVEMIVAESYSEDKEGLAIMNRLIRASGGKKL